jgi:uncharacterized protein with HEPN domain
MPDRTSVARLTDIIEAIERIRNVISNVTLDAFEADWQKQWLVERGIEIISEASRHLGGDLKARHPQIPWPKVAGIGNVLRHDYERIAPDVIWKLAQADLPVLERVCRIGWRQNPGESDKAPNALALYWDTRRTFLIRSAGNEFY